MKKINIITVTILVNTFLLFSCRKDVSNQVSSPESYSGINAKNPGKKLTVTTVAQLYSAVNDPNNAGAEINLSPGVYLLDASYPNGGRLELQNDMQLVGQPGQSEAVLIDQSALPVNSFRLTPTVSTGGIRVGKGDNSLEWLSIKGGALAVNPFSVIETDLLGEHTSLSISHVIVNCNGSRTGIMLRNRLDEHSGRVIQASLEHNEMFGAVNAPGAGIGLQNRISGASIELSMQDNYIHGNKIAILQFNGGLGNSLENCTTQIVSHVDRIEGNGCGMDPSGGTNGSGATYVNNNIVSIRMFGTALRNNNPTGHPELIPTNGALPGAIYVAGGYNSLNNIVAYNHVNSNQVTIELTGCDISENNGTDIYAYGAWSPPLALLAGTYNSVDLYLRGTSANAIVEAFASVPSEPAGTNVVNVFRN